MSLVRWNPSFDLVAMSTEMDRVFDGMLRGAGFVSRLDGHGQDAGFLPVDVSRRGSEVVVEASVPGFNPDEVAVTLDGGVLSISAEHGPEHIDGSATYIRRERFSGSLRRQLTLGKGVDAEGASATFTNGVLSITIPIVQKPEPRRITVENAEATGSES
jgi:HSP20 family protein